MMRWSPTRSRNHGAAPSSLRTSRFGWSSRSLSRAPITRATASVDRRRRRSRSKLATVASTTLIGRQAPERRRQVRIASNEVRLHLVPGAGPSRGEIAFRSSECPPDPRRVREDEVLERLGVDGHDGGGRPAAPGHDRGLSGSLDLLDDLAGTPRKIAHANDTHEPSVLALSDICLTTRSCILRG